MALYTVESLSLSKIGDLLREQLGEEATSYTFPEDFKKAVVDIGFKGLVYTGDGEPYDLIVIGDGLQGRRRNNATVSVLGGVRSVIFIGNPTSIPTFAFAQEITLSDILLPETITSIGTSAFHGCTSLKNIVLPDSLVNQGVTGLGESIFNGAGLTSINSNKLTIIPRYFCSNCTNLLEANFPEATELKYQCCYQDTSLLTVNAAKVNIMMDTGNGQQFRGCTNLKTVNLGSIDNAVQTVGNAAFQGCTRADLIITVYTLGEYLNTLRTNIRNGATNATIIFKASGDTVYSGTTYSAGDTILTSTP